jgi:ATP-dependent DNA helicase RecG
MTPTELTTLLERLIAAWEGEVVEFKRASGDFNTDKIGSYFSALTNEANLRGVERGWLVFGVDDKTRKVVGTNYRPERERLESVKQQIVTGTEPRLTFREIHELAHPDGRVLLFEVAAAPRGLPVSWQGRFFGRAGEGLTTLSLDKLDEIRGQAVNRDWSAVVVPEASTADLDVDAVVVARKAFAQRHPRIDPSQIDDWPLETFLERARLTRNGGITRTALLLLGKPEASHHLTPLLAEITWRLLGEETAYEHFGLPFLLSTTRLYERIRNVQIRLLPPGTLVQAEIPKYDRKSLLEAIHNCIAHADYTTGARIVVTERVDRVELVNSGGFVDGEPEDYVITERVPQEYRNPFLVAAMTELNMIDRMGFGIRQMHVSQVQRYLPMPSYDLSRDGEVKLSVYGSVIDSNYTDVLMAGLDLPLVDVLALDRVQKNLPISDQTARRMRRVGLIEGKKPLLHVSAAVAAATGTKADYIRTRAQDDEHYAKLILDYLEKFGSAKRREIDDLLLKHLSDGLSEDQKRYKVTNLLTKMRTAGQIHSVRSGSASRWELVKSRTN